jgi:hypothetical protein
MVYKSYGTDPLPHFLTNLPEIDAELYERAAQITRTPVYIKQDATCSRGCPLRGYVAAWTNSSKSHTSFWKAVAQLRKERDAQ